MPYKNILVAVDLGATTETIIRRAAALARQDDAELHVLHVIEPLAITYGETSRWIFLQYRMKSWSKPESS
ncbi:MAG: hypothetical protein CM15mP84_03580 [Cellvibrionales bacterium]|nr:MAG: hypothetical protein CM15mP84_03580 [Cellvibrionales bacterium]